MSLLRALPLALLLPACTPAPQAELLERHPLAVVTGVDESAAVGITVDPDTGAVLVLDRNVGVVQADLSGGGGQWQSGATLLLARDEFPVPDVAPRSEWTDIVALGGGRFALTAQTQGFLLDLDAGTLTQHFCYVPGFDGGDPTPQIDQITNSVAYDADADLLYAQPETFDPATGDVRRADIGSFDGTTGADLTWTEIEGTDFPAGGIALDGDGHLLLAYDDVLQERSLYDGELTAEDTDLSGFDLQAVAGMTRDPATGHYLLIDPASDQLVRIVR
jgi:hypothetical protein